MSVRVVRGHVSVSRLLSAKFKASYAESRMWLMCDISAVKLEQNVTGGCQEILQTVTLQRPNAAPLGVSIETSRPAPRGRILFIDDAVVLFLRNISEFIVLGFRESKRTIHLLPSQVWGEPIKDMK